MLDFEDLNKVEQLVQARTKFLWDDVRGFIVKQNILSLAIGVILGTALNALVTAFLADLVMPLLNLLIKNQTWRQWGPPVSEFIDDKGHAVVNKILLGDLLWNGLNLLVAGLVAYLLWRVLLRPLSVANTPVRTCPYCLENVAQAARRCKYCTSELVPVADDGPAV